MKLGDNIYFRENKVIVSQKEEKKFIYAKPFIMHRVIHTYTAIHPYTIVRCTQMSYMYTAVHIGTQQLITKRRVRVML